MTKFNEAIAIFGKSAVTKELKALKETNPRFFCDLSQYDYTSLEMSEDFRNSRHALRETNRQVWLDANSRTGTEQPYIILKTRKDFRNFCHRTSFSEGFLPLLKGVTNFEIGNGAFSSSDFDSFIQRNKNLDNPADRLLKKVSRLKISRSELTNGDIDNIFSYFLELKEIFLPFCKIENVANFFNRASNLERINLSDCRAISNLDGLPQDLSKLKEADFSYSGITNQGLENFLHSATNLKRLNLSHCYTISNLDGLPQNLSKLKEADFSYSNATDQGLANFLHSATNLERLNLLYCREISHLDGLPQYLPKLKEADFSYSDITDQGLANFLHSATNLERLKLSRCSAIHNLDGLPQDLYKLKEADFSDSNITNQGLANFLHSATNLERLDLSFCCEISHLEGLPQDLSKLKEVDFSYSDITDQGLANFLTNAHNLEKIVLDECPNISEELRSKTVEELYVSLGIERKPKTSVDCNNIAAQNLQGDVQTNLGQLVI